MIEELFIITGRVALAVTSGSLWCTSRHEAKKSSLLGSDLSFVQSSRAASATEIDIGVSFAGARPRQQALRVLKKKMQREGVFREMKLRRFYEKPSERATRQKGRSVAQRTETCPQAGDTGWLIAAPKNKRIAIGKTAGAPRISAPQFHRPAAMR
jgi:small subunit ribosomal protein S21